MINKTRRHAAQRREYHVIISKTDIATASPKTKRAVRYEFELEHEALECVFAANNTKEFRLMMEARVLADARFDRLPAYRQVAVDAYVRGALDAMARLHGLPVSQAPASVQPQPRMPSAPPRASKRVAKVTHIGEPGVSFPNVWAFGANQAAARKPD